MGYNPYIRLKVDKIDMMFFKPKNETTYRQIIEMLGMVVDMLKCCNILAFHHLLLSMLASFPAL